MLSLVTHDGCQWNALAAYFGETARRAVRPLHATASPARRGSCRPRRGHLPTRPRRSTPAELARLAAEHPDALGAPRQRARFLCGITSPATTRARLTRDPLFGALADRRFADVLAWCATRAS